MAPFLIQTAGLFKDLSKSKKSFRFGKAISKEGRELEVETGINQRPSLGHKNTLYFTEQSLVD
jgi:hypothetical protein